MDTYQNIMKVIQNAVEQFCEILGYMYKPKQELKKKLELSEEKLNDINTKIQ